MTVELRAAWRVDSLVGLKVETTADLRVGWVG